MTVMNLIAIFFLIATSSAVPINLVGKVAENDFEAFDNYLPKIGDFPKFHYSTFDENKDSNENLLDVIDFKSFDESPKFDSNAGKEGSKEGKANVTSSPDLKQETTTAEPETTTFETTTNPSNDKYQLDPVLLDENGNLTTNRTTRQKESDEENDVEFDDNVGSKKKENQESDEEEEPDMITGLISAFLGGLSRPDGSVDIEAITGLLGSLSNANEDGTYDFSGLTELLMSFFGGTEDGGGSNFGAFLGGLAGAFLKGIANPPGAKGTGIFAGNFLTAILPGLSGPAPTEEGETTSKPQPPIDSGSFLGGFLKTVLPNLGSLSGGSSGSGDSGGGGSKFSIFKAIFSSITSLFTASSSWN